MLASGFHALIVPSAAEPSRVEEANSRNDRGVQLWQVGRRSEAVAAFDQAARADARFAVPWHNRGAVYLIEGQFTQAIHDLAHAVELAPGWTLPRTHLAQAYLRAGETRLALATSDAARALDPTLPDVRIELRTILRARADLAALIAARRRTFFLITLVVAVLITILTAGIGFASLALPVYRFVLFAEAARQRDETRRQLREMDSAAPSAASPAPPAPQWTTDTPYVSAGVLPAFSASEMDPRVTSGTGYRRTGWALLITSLIFMATGIAAIIAFMYLPVDTTNGSTSTVLEGGALSLSGIVCLAAACIAVAAAVLVGAVAAFRRGRRGWGIAILTVGVLGIVCYVVPAQLMVLLYLLAMPSTPGKRALEPAHMTRVTV